MYEHQAFVAAGARTPRLLSLGEVSGVGSVTALMTVVLIFLTFDTIKQISVDTPRVPAYSVINQRIDYRFNASRHRQVPIIGEDAPLFGRRHTEEEAKALVTKGKMTIQV